MLFGAVHGIVNEVIYVSCVTALLLPTDGFFMHYCHIITLVLAATLFAALPSSHAHAQDLIPPVTQGAATADMATTHPMLRLTPDKSELVRLDRNAISVVVGNPAHLSVLLDTPNTLVLVPRAAGATHFTVLDAAGEVVMQRHVVVASPKKNYVRVRRSCANGGEGCRATSVYFCPDICHEIDTPQLGTAVGTPSVPDEAPTPAPGAASQPTATRNADGQMSTE